MLFRSVRAVNLIERKATAATEYTTEAVGTALTEWYQAFALGGAIVNLDSFKIHVTAYG